MILNPSAPAAAPEEGQLVSVRDRHWIVKAVAASSLPLDVMSPEQSTQHLVELASVEDDGPGDELTVVWEIEPGTRIFFDARNPVVNYTVERINYADGTKALSSRHRLPKNIPRISRYEIGTRETWVLTLRCPEPRASGRIVNLLAT